MILLLEIIVLLLGNALPKKEINRVGAGVKATAKMPKLLVYKHTRV